MSSPSQKPKFSRRAIARPVFGLLGAAALVAVASAPASATAVTHRPAPSVELRGAHGVRPHASSSYLAGYTATPNALASASATFVVPTVNCPAGGPIQGTALGVGDETTFGTPTVISVVEITCDDGTAAYQFVVEANASTFTEAGVGAGDTVVTSWFETASIEQATVHDMTSGYTWIANDGPVPDATATFGAFPIFSSGFQTGPPKFKPVTFTKCQMNGDYLGYAAPTMLSLKQGSKVLISTSALKTTSDTFKLTWHSSGSF